MGISFVEKQYLHIYTKVKRNRNTIFDVETKFANSLKVVIDFHLLSCLQRSQKHMWLKDLGFLNTTGGDI